MTGKKDNTVKFFIIIIGLAVIALILRELSHIFLPFVIAYFLFFLFSPLNTFFKNKKVPLFLIIIFDLAVTAFIAWGVIKVIYDSFYSFAENVPIYEKKLNSLVSETAVYLGFTDPSFTNFSITETLASFDYQALAGGVFTSTISLTGSLLFILFFFVFIVSGHENIYEAIKKRFIDSRIKPELKKIKQKLRPENPDDIAFAEKMHAQETESGEKVSDAFKKITLQIQRYIIAKIGVNLIAGAAVTLALYIAGIDFPIIWGVFTFLFNFIPTIGSAISLVLPTIMALIQFESIGSAVLILILMAVIQTIFFNILEPMIMGRRLNLNPLLILFSLLVWGYIWGIPGMLLSIPLTAIIKIIISGSESKNLKFLSDLMDQG